MTYDCIHGRSPVYFRDICSPIVSVPFRSRLRSADNDDMIVPRRVKWGKTGREAKRDSAIFPSVVGLDHWFIYLFNAYINF